jgi:hypothetical protein
LRGADSCEHAFVKASNPDWIAISGRLTRRRFDLERSQTAGS